LHLFSLFVKSLCYMYVWLMLLPIILLCYWICII
jgi:hypothetical protein